MKKIMIPIGVLAVFTAVSCGEKNNEQVNPEAQWSDKGIYSSAEVNIPDDEYSDPENSVDNALAEFILNELTKRNDVEFSDGENLLTSQEVRELLYSVVDRIVEDPDAPGNFIEVTDTMRIEPHNIIEILTQEDWAFDRERMTLVKKVNKLAPIAFTYDVAGNRRGKRILFWVKLNN
jgi:hypothetical protein